MNMGAVEGFAEGLDGDVLRPGETGFEEARTLWNAMIDKKPALIVRCRTTSDVVRAVNFARDGALPLAVRGGGHNVSGLALCDDGLVIDLSPMKGIRVDSERRAATAQAGTTWGEFDRATQAFRLATTGGVIPATGIAGLTLGGGFGWLMRKHGLACDNLLAAETVTADGRVLRANAEENPDLFWGLRGGGGNFGVVTSFQFRLHPVSEILGGAIVHPLNRARAALRFYRKFTEGAPDELTTFAGLSSTPDGTPVAIILPAYFGPADEGERILRPLREFGPPLIDDVDRIWYEDLQKMLEPSYPAGLRNYWKSSFLTDLNAEAIDTIAEHFAAVPSTRTAVLLEHFGGAIARIGRDETAFDHRDAEFNFTITSIWAEPAEDEANVRWTRELWQAMQAFSAGRVYVNYLGEEPERVREAYGSKYDRLVALKRKYDPSNLFRYNQNIRPDA